MTLGLDLTDNATVPTGVVATVTGTSDDVTLYYTPADRPWPGDDWIFGGAAGGGGSIAVALPKRHYFFWATNGSDSSLPVRLAVTDGLDELASRCRDATIAILKALNLEGIGDRVYNQMTPDETNSGIDASSGGIKYPCAIVHVTNVSESQEAGTNELDTIGYPVVVQFFDFQKVTEHEKLLKYERWRGQTQRAFRDQHLQGVPETVYTRVAMQNIAPVTQEKYEKYMGGLLITNFVREPRGQGA